jgi:DNA-3-methyladenine glycosylase II
MLYPKADLGVQRGVLRWFLSLHSPTYNVIVTPNKVKSPEEKKAQAQVTPKSKGKGRRGKGEAKVDDNALPLFGEAATDGIAMSSVPPGPVFANPLSDSGATEEEVGTQVELPSMPAPFTPSINRTLNAVKMGTNPPPLPDGLTITILKNRLNPKNKVK